MYQKLCFEKQSLKQDNSPGQYFDKLYLNAASCQTAHSTKSVRTAIEQELKDLTKS